jgi:GNAT superfamily N-acetyltransferase
MGLKVRKAMRGDAAEMADVLSRSIVELCVADHQNDPAAIASWTRNKTEAGVTGWFDRGQVDLFVAEVDGKIVAVGGTRPDGEIELNYVAPDARFTGASKALMEAMEDYLLTQSVAVATLRATKTARRFYLGLGYVEGEEERRPGELVPATRMERTLSWPSGWWAITDAEHRRVFREELASELGRGHPLKGLALAPIARADGQDDYLFATEDGRVAEVHLTFANRPERPPWPGHALFESLAAWRKAKAEEQET